MSFRYVRATLIAATCAIAACSAPTVMEGDGTTTENVTNIPESSVQDQGQTGNCWLYATAAWVESLQAQTQDGIANTHYSPAYWLYWRLYDQLVAQAGQVSFGGWWGEAGYIIQRYGLMEMGKFTSDDVQTALTAVQTVNARITSGDLTARDPAAVRTALDAAFGLDRDMSALLTSVFGADGTATFKDTAVAQGTVLSPQSIHVRSAANGHTTTTTLDLVFGDKQPDSFMYDDRTGPEAWSAIYAPNADPGAATFSRPPGSITSVSDSPEDDDASDVDAGGSSSSGNNGTDQSTLPELAPADPAVWRPYFKRIQRALNDGFPLPIAFAVVFDDIGPDGRFTLKSQRIDSSGYGLHEVILTDYEVTNVPGFGTLAAGQIATDEEKAAALDDSATVSFFRVKNSWGTSTYNASRAGYNDLDATYLDQETYLCSDPSNAASCRKSANQIRSIVLPPGY